MVFNKDSGAEEEIDILISFPTGGRVYKTGVAVRQRGRKKKGSASWIRDLAVQRAGCGLDKIIAAHTSGFSPAAQKQANASNVDLVSILDVTDADLLEAIGPFEGLEFFKTRSCKIQFVAATTPRQPVDWADVVSIGGRPAGTAREFRRFVCDALHKAVSEAPGCSGRAPRRDRDTVFKFNFLVEFPRSSYVLHSNGYKTRIKGANGSAEVLRVQRAFQQIEAITYNGKLFRNATSKETQLTVEHDGARPVKAVGTVRIPSVVSEIVVLPNLVLSIDDLERT
jgi:hypothetical protein